MSAQVGLYSEVEPQLFEHPRQTERSSLWKRAGIGAIASLAVVGTVARLSYTRGLTASSSLSSVEGKFQEVVSPGRQFCSKSTEDCYDTGCCKTEGYMCFETEKGKAKCMKKCDPSKFVCEQRTVLEEARVVPTPSLYCFAVVVKDTGSDKVSHELDLMNHQANKNLGVFQCEQNGLFSDAALTLDNGRPFTQVFDKDKDWHFAKRKETGSWVNTGLFSDVWRAIASEGKVQSADWVVKVDPDAVFIVPRLKTRLESTMEVMSGTYLTNCPYVDYGFFGNLEVFSKTAFRTLLDHIDDCKADTGINWKIGVKKGKYGPMGEDLFAQTCMDKWGVKKSAAFDITQDGACESKRDKDQAKNKKWQPHCDWAYGATLHPFKKVDQWSACYEQTMAAYPNPL